MAKYKIYFGTDFSNNGQIDSFDNLVYYDNNGSKTVKDVKAFITCFNDEICSCMLKLYKKESGWISYYYSKYDIKNEDDKKLQEIANNSEICIIQTQRKCTCKNKELFSLNKENLIEKIKELQKKLMHYKKRMN